MNATPAEKAAREQRLAEAVRTVLECIGEDPDREGLQRTPIRYAQALMWMTKGYEDRLMGECLIVILREKDASCMIRIDVDVIGNAIFPEDHEEMVIVKDIDIFSLCEHHLVPFIGKVPYSNFLFIQSITHLSFVLIFSYLSKHRSR